MKLREKLCIWLFECSKIPYAKYFKRTAAWGLNSTQLLTYPTNSLGHVIGLFLKYNGFEMIPKLERHDAYHVITGYETSVKGEIELQYFLTGNGKRSLYQLASLTLGTLLLPEYYHSYIRAFQRGKTAYPIYTLDLLPSLHIPMRTLKEQIFPLTHSNN